jgi:hypothetical protein
MSEKDLDLGQIEARLAAISLDSEWLEVVKSKPRHLLVYTDEDEVFELPKEFIANAPTDIAALVARVRELEAENKARFTEGAKETKERVLSAIDMAGLMEVKFGTKDRARVIAEIKLLVQSIEVEVE